ncbi:MAG: Ig-like domain-containing protein [Muribaculaceae bacterium]|nr:Ig-like domain-containing protein [Muribaculaceae bacterium]MCM1511422.1 Ig-like domain-containing protein [Clostridium sp.]
MATKPKAQALTPNTADILNAIRNNASANYQANVPYAVSGNMDTLRAIGSVITSYEGIRNEFVGALMNRIARVIVTSKSYQNPWAMFKKGIVDYGETVEEVFVNLAKPFEYDPERAEQTVFKRELPDVRSAFHVMNYQKFYKVTISDDQLRQAFLSWEGVTDLIARITEQLYNGANYDEFLTMKYLLARRLLSGLMHVTTVNNPTDKQGYLDAVSEIKGVSNSMEFLSSKYNLMGVYNATPKDDQYLIISAAMDAKLDVEVLASAFNMDKATFMGHRVLVDNFGELDTARLEILFADDPSYVPITEDEMTALNTISAVLVDKDFFMIFDNLLKFTENYNGEGLYWNYFWHVWKTFSVSPFANNTAFIAGTPSVTSVEVTPGTATAMPGMSVQFMANVTTENFAPQSVTWTSSNDAVTVGYDGRVTVPQGASGSVTITATSTFDTTKSASATLTIQ